MKFTSIILIALTALFLMAGAGSAASGDSTGDDRTDNMNHASAIHFEVSGFPSPTIAGDIGGFTVRAKYANGKTATGYTGTVNFTSSDALAELPPDTFFIANDKGIHNFSARLNTEGIHWLNATEVTNSLINGSQRDIKVAPIYFVVSGFPSPTIAGDIGSFTVTAKYVANGTTATNYTGTVHFTSSDAQAELPIDTFFIASDKGIHPFSARLKTAGTLKATDKANSGITGTQTIIVKPDHADRLIFASQPSDTVPEGIISPPVKVEIRDQYNNLVTGSNTWVTVAIDSNPGHGTLSGTKSRKAINGIATFDDLSINKAGTGYTLKASSSGLSSVTSSKFDIKVNPPTYTHTITPSPMVGVRVKDTVTSTSTSGTDMEFKWIRPDGHTASTDSVPRSHDDTYVDSYKPNVAGLWTINVKEFDRHHVTLGESSTSFTVTENPEFGKLGAVLPLFTIGFIYMNYRKKIK